jgi:hypothetical protein
VNIVSNRSLDATRMAISVAWIRSHPPPSSKPRTPNI